MRLHVNGFDGIYDSAFYRQVPGRPVKTSRDVGTTGRVGSNGLPYGG